MTGNTLDIITVIGYFVITLAVGFWYGRGKQDSADQYFISKKNLPWWAIGAAYVAKGLNSEQLIGINGGCKDGNNICSCFHSDATFP